MNRSRFPRLFFLFCLSCTLYAQNSIPNQGRLAVVPEDPRPGEHISAGYYSPEPIQGKIWAALYNIRGQRLSRAAFFPLNEGGASGGPLAAILAVPSTAVPGAALLRAEDANGAVLAETGIIIKDRSFLSEEIPLDQANTNIRTVPDPQKTAESERLWAIISRTGSSIYDSGLFRPPVSSTRRTSFFGDRRVFRYTGGGSETSIHAGVDYGVPLDTPVYACANGQVVLASFRIVTGYSVIIEHAPGLYSLYYHLSKIETEEGAMVETGTLLGKSGSTGLSTGPHLHWEIRLAGENADPDAFIQRPVLDKKLLLSKLGLSVSLKPYKAIWF